MLATLPPGLRPRPLGEAGAAWPLRVTAITLDQPLPRLMAFIRQLFPDKHKVFADRPRRYPPSPAPRSGLPPGSRPRAQARTSRNEHAGSRPRPAFRQDRPATALLDASVYRRDNIRVILLTSTAISALVIALVPRPSSRPAPWLHVFDAEPDGPANRRTAAPTQPESIRRLPSRPPLFSLAVNRNVAQSLGLSLPDDASLRRSIGADREAR